MTRSTTGPAPATPLPSPEERRRLREARALSEEQVAEAVGVTPGTVRAWEAGRTDPRGRRRDAYARLIGCADGDAMPDPPAGSATTGQTPPGPPCPAAGATAAPAATPAPAPAPGTADEADVAAAPDTDAPDAAEDTCADTTCADTTWAGRTAAEDTGAEDGPPPDEPPPALPRSRHALTAEDAFDTLYARTAPGLTRQMYLLTGRRKLAGEAVEHAFRVAWQRWPEVATDRDPAGWVRAVSYEYAMSPWHRWRRTHRRPDALPEDPGRRALLGALLALPPANRRTLLLHDGVGLGLPETAAETEASTLAAASRLLNARAAVSEVLPELGRPKDSGARTALLQERLGALALAEQVAEPSSAPAVRKGGERVAELWTRAAICFGVLLIGATGYTLHTAPTHYEQPLSPPHRVGGVPPLSGPGKLTSQDLKLQKSLREELTHGPERLVPRIP
ncbi:helix-turn-helix domain-containing protein [Streptomyces sp. NPDC059166]|uniref:transcriptional regulator n=1 Tax=Streptomyces sp. NPDC059166 TaxID=3346752 RepID=UPI003696D0D8